MIVLTPGVFITTLKGIPKDPEEKKDGKHAQKVYPIEIFVGGSISNIGLEQPTLSAGNDNGTLTFFFQTNDQ